MATRKAKLKRLASLLGTDPSIEAAPRRRPPDFTNTPPADPVPMTIIRVEVSPGATRATDIFTARVDGDPDAGLVFTGRTAAEAVGKLVITLGLSLKLRVIQIG